MATELAYTKGLKFTAGAPTDKLDSKAKVRLNYGSSRLELNGNGVSLIIPSLKAGQRKSTVSCKTGSTSTARCLDAANLTSVSGSFGTPTKDQVTNVGTVTADGDVVLKTNGGGMNIYSIKVETVGERIYRYSCSHPDKLPMPLLVIARSIRCMLPPMLVM